MAKGKKILEWGGAESFCPGISTSPFQSVAEPQEELLRPTHMPISQPAVQHSGWQICSPCAPVSHRQSLLVEGISVLL